MANGHDGGAISVTRATIPLVLFCGVVAGFVGLIFTNMFTGMEANRQRIATHDHGDIALRVDSLKREIDLLWVQAGKLEKSCKEGEAESDKRTDAAVNNLLRRIERLEERR